MAESRLKISLEAQDKLSPVLKGAQNALVEMGEKSSRLDQIRERFDKISNSTAPLNKQLKDIQKLMSEMNYEGMDATPLFTQMAEKAGSLKDAMSDARQAVNAFADDNFKLEAMAQGMSLIASAGSIATGTMGLFGVQNEKVAQAILKVQSSLAILNGVQQVANVLNKDSALMLRLKQIRMVASTSATKANTAATTANTIAENLNGASIKRGTVVQNAWNVAKAVGKALMGDFTGLLLVAAAGITTYAIATADSTDELEKNNEKLSEQEKALERQKEVMNKYRDSVKTNASSLITSFLQLQTQWKQLSTEMEKSKWIEKNQKAFKQLGIDIKNVVDAENILINNSKRVVQALMLRASQDALADMMKEYVDNYVKQVDIAKNSVSGGGYYETYKYEGSRKLSDYTGSKYNKKTVIDKYGLKEGEHYTKKDVGYNTFYYLNDKAIAEVEQKENQRRNDEALKRQKQNIENAEKELEAGKTKIEKLTTEFKNKFGSFSDIITESFIEDEPTTTSSTGGSPTDKVKTALEIYRDLEQQAKNVESQFKVGLIDEEEAKKRVDTINAEIQKKFGDKAKPVEIDLGLKSDLQIYSDFQKLEGDIQKRFDLGIINEEDAKNQIEALNKKLQEQLGDGVKLFNLKVSNTIENGSLSAVSAEISEIEEMLSNMDISLNPQKFEEAMKKLIELYDKRDEISKKLSTESVPSIQALDNKRFEKGSLQDRRLSYDNTMDQINQVGSDLSKGLISYEDAKSKVQELVDRLQTEFPDIELNVKVNDDGSIEIVKNDMSKLGNVVGNVGNIFNTLGSSMQSLAGDNEALAKSALIASAIGQLALSFAQAMKGTMTPWDWIAGAIAGVATLTSVVAQLSSFATGGIVGGTSYQGDKQLVRVNSGEMILNKRQQNNLYKAINDNKIGEPNFGGKVVFDIEGTKLRGVLNNTNRKISKQS